MENASKALIMAGSVLLAILIIGALVYTFNLMSNLKTTEQRSAEAEKLVKANKEIEKFNREGLYGSEILSLCNFIKDYNNKYNSDLGYTEITLLIYTNGIPGAKWMKQNYEADAYNKLTQDFSKLESEIESYKKQTYYSKSIEQLSGMRTFDLKQLINANETTSETRRINMFNEIQQKISQYNNLKSEMTEFKNKKFKMPETVYDPQNSRITKMTFREV